jgi:hypothetical protein
VLRALGVASTWREPDKIFNGVLFEGEEIELTSALKLKRGNIHGEPVIELRGADPGMFGVLRKLGLINEQINWKQRFFVPTEEEPGIAILAAVLEQFPVIATEDEEADCYAPSDLVMPSGIIMQPIDLGTWIIDIAESHNMNDDVEEQHTVAITENKNDAPSDESESTCSRTSQSECWPIARQASVAAMLQTLRSDYRTPSIQIGFNFAESES